MSCPFESEIFKDLLTAFFGAGFGATAAFLFQSHREENKRKKDDYQALTEAYFLLCSRLNSLESFVRKAFEGDSLKEDLEFQYVDQYFHDEKIKFGSLSVLADKKDSQFLVDLRVAESNYFNFLSAIKQRNLHLKNFISSAIIDDIDPYDRNKTIKAKGHQFDIMDDLTGHLSRSTITARRVTGERMNALGDIIGRRFPDEYVAPFKIDGSNQSEVATP